MFSLNLNHFFRLAAGVSFPLLSSVAFSQEFMAIKGNLLDADTKAPLDCATVTLAGAPLGVVTGEKGACTSYIPAKSFADTLVLRMLGYEQLRLPVSVAEAKKQFLLKPKSIPIEEVTVVAIPVKEILRRAFKSVKKNYPREPFLLTGDFQEYIREGDKYVRAMEASVSLYDKNSLKVLDESFNIDSISLSVNRIDDKFLPLLSKDQILSAYYSVGNILRLGSVYDDVTYTQEKVIWNGDEKVYEITGKGETYKETYRINASDYAIVYFQYLQTVPSKNGSEINDVWRDELDSWYSIEFRRVDSYYYPFQVAGYETLRQHKGKNNPVALYTHTTTSQLLVTNIQPNVGVSGLKKSKQHGDVYFSKAPKREKWKNYNSLPNSEVRREALKQLGVE